jgi:hypothetical protein
MPSNLLDSMHWQIYRAYLNGPRALFRLFEDTFGKATLHAPFAAAQSVRSLRQQVVEVRASKLGSDGAPARRAAQPRVWAHDAKGSITGSVRSGMQYGSGGNA